MYLEDVFGFDGIEKSGFFPMGFVIDHHGTCAVKAKEGIKKMVI